MVASESSLPQGFPEQGSVIWPDIPATEKQKLPGMWLKRQCGPLNWLLMWTQAFEKGFWGPKLNVQATWEAARLWDTLSEVKSWSRSWAEVYRWITTFSPESSMTMEFLSICLWSGKSTNIEREGKGIVSCSASNNIKSNSEKNTVAAKVKGTYQILGTDSPQTLFMLSLNCPVKCFCFPWSVMFKKI